MASKLITQSCNALMPDGRASAMQAIAVKMFRDSMLHLIDGVYGFMRGIYEDLWGDTMREDALINWEKQFGLAPAPTDSLANRALMVEAAWAMTGYCGPGYIQAALQFAGFDIVVKENYPAVNLLEGDIISFSEQADIVPDPRDEDPLLQFADYAGGPTFDEGTYDGYLLGNGSLQLNSGALLDPIVPPEGDGSESEEVFTEEASSGEDPLPQFIEESISGDDPAPQFGGEASDWGYIFIIEGVGGVIASIPSQRRTALESLVLRLKPAHLGVFMRVRYD